MSDWHRAIIDAATDAIITVDETQRIVQFNHAAERLLGIQADEAIGLPLANFVPGRFRADHVTHVQAFAQTGATRRTPSHPITAMALRADGTEFAAEAWISRATVGGTEMYTVFLRDAAPRQHTETQLQRARTMDAVAQLAGGVAHDFNNLLMVILGNLELMETSHGDELVAKGFAREAKSAAERGTALARQLLAFSRKAPLPRQPADLNAVVARNEAALRRAAGRQCTLEIVSDEAPRVVECNAAQLDQLLLNLVANARDAMADGGAITICVDRLEISEADGERWPTLATGAYVRLRVSDTGAGMSEEARRRAFEPFFTTKPAGPATGLGLAAVFGIASQLGGAVDAENNADVGSTFTVLLPASDKPVVDDAIGSHARPKRGHGVVLLVDDEAAVRATIRMILTKNGYSVIEAGNGREALAEFDRRNGRIDLVLTDLRMPEMDGRTLTAELRARRESLPVLLMTGYDDGSDAAVANGRDAEYVLHKPFTAPTLLESIAARLT